MSAYDWRHRVPPAGSGFAGVASGTLADDRLARHAHRVVVFRSGLSRDDLGGSRSSDSRWRRGRARSGQEVVKGCGGAVRCRRGIGHDPQLRNGLVVAGVHASVRRRDRASVRVGGHRVLPGGDLPRHLPVRLGTDAGQAASCGPHTDCVLGCCRHVLHLGGELVDELAERISHRRWQDHRRRPVGGDVQPRGLAAVPPHVDCNVHGRRLLRRRGLRDRAPAWAR